MNTLSFKRVVQVALVVAFLVPAFSMAEVDLGAAGLAALTKEIKETYTPEKLESMDPESRARAEQILSTLAAIPAISDNMKKKETWDNISKQYKELQERGAKSYKAQLDKRFKDATAEQKAAGQIPSNAGSAFADADARLNNSQTPQECKFATEFPSAIQQFKGLDQDAASARAKGIERSEKEAKRLKKEFQDGLVAAFAKSMGTSSLSDTSADALKKVQELAKQINDPAAFEQLTKTLLKDAKDKAAAEEVATKVAYLHPEDGLLAKIDRLQENDSDLATYAETVAADLEKRYNTAIQLFTKSLSATENNCADIRSKIAKDAKAVEAGMRKNAVEFAGENGDQLENNISEEKGKLTKAKNSMFCDGSRARTVILNMQSEVSAKISALRTPKKNPKAVRADITAALAIGPNMGPALTSAAEQLNQDCEFGTTKWKKLMEDSTRKETAALGKSKRQAPAPTNNSLVGGPQSRPGQPGQQNRGNGQNHI